MKKLTIVHACGCVRYYDTPANDPNQEIATGLALQVCVECERREDWMDVQKRAEKERNGRING